MMRFAALAFLGAATAFRKEGAPVRASLAAEESYSFDQFAKNFGRQYKSGSAEYEHRLKLFQASVARIHAINAKNAREHRMWTAGVHPFMDWTEAERKILNGYKPSRSLKRPASHMTVMQTNLRATSKSALATRSNTSYEKDFSWDQTPGIRQQGSCGSCWAISAVEAVESQLQQQGGDPSVRVSAQALVDCTPNPQHCGGTGGCDGATGELAYAYMRDHGIPLESELHYTAETGTCKYSSDGLYPAQTRARVSGWNQLPSNKNEPIMQALVSQGPAVVSVDGNNWFDYKQGVFDGCDKDAVLGHAVLLKGYGEEAGQKYWRIQNSWGYDWGENGHIRLKRPDDEDNYCGTDRKPQEGSGCDGGPSEVTVCGMCGMLYEAIVPEGVRLEKADDPSSSIFSHPTDSAVSSAPPAYQPWKPTDNATTTGAKTKMQSLLDEFQF